MLFRALVFVLLVSFDWEDAVLASDKEEFDWKGNIRPSWYHDDSDWVGVHSTDYVGRQSVCKDNVTTTYLQDSSDGPLAIYFQPKDQNGILGMSFCSDVTREDCYVMEIFGLISGRLGYFWRKHSQNDTGEELWVPGRDTKLPSTLIKSDVAVKKGTWDPEGQTLYQFYIDFRDNQVEVRYDGGTAKQQREMIFKVSQRTYNFTTVVPYYNDSQVDIEGARGCPIYKRTLLEPGQLMQVRWYKPSGSVGISLCTDSGQYECYVFEGKVEFIGNSTFLIYYWRKHSALDESGEEDWVPGLNTKLRGIVLTQENVSVVEDYPWDDNYLEIYFTIIKGSGLYTELVRFSIGCTEYNDKGSDRNSWRIEKLTLDLPSQFQYIKVRNRATVNGKEVIGADVSLLGPCFEGIGLSPFCKQQFSKDIIDSRLWDYGFSPVLGKAEANLMSVVLESTTTRRNLCVYLKAIVGAKGGKIILTAMDASKTTNQTVKIGELTYNVRLQ